MSYTVFARKWRPQTFDEVIGQPHIATTLKNAIKLNRVAHAYLFCGPRGVGKTSIARIFAKSLNCVNGPSEIPCGKCSNCVDITAGNSMDVLEIDGASNRRIDDIREIGENVQFAPNNSNFKIYIIDEVHMLTKEAFNALLKTLEEPPAHIKFIFATTEPEKVLDTIISRCQKFEFRCISIKDIALNLKTILEKEKLSIDEEILYDIARLADGSMRDALSFLDQLVSFNDKEIKKQDVEDILGFLGFGAISNFAHLIIECNTEACLDFINTVALNGKDIYNVLIGLINYMRELILICVSKDSLSNVISLTPEELKTAENIIENVTLEKLVYILNVLLELEVKIKKHNMPRIPFEVAIIKLTHLSDLKSLKQLISGIETGSIEKIEIKQETSPSFAMLNKTEQNSVVSKPVKIEVKPLTPVVTEVKENKEVNVSTAVADNGLAMEHRVWSVVVSAVKKERMALGVILEKAEPVKFDGKEMHIMFSEEDEFYKNNVEDEDNKKLIFEVSKHVLNKEMKLSIGIKKSEKKIVKTAKQVEKSAVNRLQLLQEPIVKKTLSVFNGKVLDIIQK
jgi:DNA polymerase III subunit gamma/tau